jgi:LacI family transcriptional regulator
MSEELSPRRGVEPQTAPTQDSPPGTSRPLSIAVLVEFDDMWGRNVLEAISCCARDAGWRLLLSPRDEQRRLRIPAGWQGDGVIVMLRERSLLEHIREVGLPTVDVGATFLTEESFGRIATDDVDRARMAVDHFRSRQLVHFAYFSPLDDRYPQLRGEKFRQAVEEEGFPCSVYLPATNREPSANDHDAIGEWLASLPKPIGIFAPDPFPARQLVEACHSRRIDIPSEVAVLSGDEDELLCSMVLPEITSIELASHRIGFEACQMLMQIIDGGPIPAKPLLIPPLRVCARRSTEAFAVDDPALAAVVKMIWERASAGIQVRDLVRASSMSRRALELRFRRALGRTPAEEIRRVRLEIARQLIVTTSMSVGRIALATGFSSGPYLTHAFRRQFRVTPSALRVGLKFASSLPSRAGGTPFRRPEAPAAIPAAPLLPYRLTQPQSTK